MSTKTTIKRIALVAVSALGFGMLSVVPSTAAVSSVNITTGNGSASVATGLAKETATAASISIYAFSTNATIDSFTVSVVRKGTALASSSRWKLHFADTATSGFAASTTSVATSVGGTDLAATYSNLAASGSAAYDSTAAFTTGASASYVVSNTASGSGWFGAKFGIMADSGTGLTRTVGTYVFTYTVTVYGSDVRTPVTYTGDLSFVVNDLATNSTVVAPAYSTAFINSGTGTSATSDAAVTAIATASADTRATIRVRTYNALQSAAPESITATLTGTAGLICDENGSVCGTSLTVAGDGDTNIIVRSNGVAGVATIAVSTTTVTFASKSVTFYAKSPKTITASVFNPVLTVGSNSSAVVATAVDASGNAWTGQLYIKAKAAADALIGGSATDPVSCSYVAADAVHYCPITTKGVGNATFTVVDESLDTDGVYAATDSAATSGELTVTVSNAAPAKVVLAFDKATYQPFEKALITVTVLDSTGKKLQGQTFANLFATGGITSSQGFGSASDTLTATSVTTSAYSGTDRTAGAKTYIVYMPAQGTVTINATGGSSLAASGQVAVSASAEVVNDSVSAATDAANEATDAANAATDAANAAAEAADAATAAAQDAQAAVAALATQVASLIAGIKAQITSLTNLVIKIQKKVKA